MGRSRSRSTSRRDRSYSRSRSRSRSPVRRRRDSRDRRDQSRDRGRDSRDRRDARDRGRERERDRDFRGGRADSRERGARAKDAFDRDIRPRSHSPEYRVGRESDRISRDTHHDIKHADVTAKPKISYSEMEKAKRERLAMVKSLTTENDQPGEKNMDGDDDGEEDDDEDEMAALLGFSGFSTTKGKPVEDNFVGAASGAVSKHKARKYRQYMNRKGGFNRPLDKI